MTGKLIVLCGVDGSGKSMNRGVLYLVWGERADAVLARSIASLELTNPGLAYEVLRLDVDDPVQGLLEKARMFELSPYESTVFLDADTVVLGKLDFIFEKAEKHGLACCHSAAPWARRYMGAGLPPDALEMNTGVLAFDRRPEVAQLFAAWKRFSGLDGATAMDSGINMVTDQVTGQQARMAANDQGSFAAALVETEFNPYVLPINWNMHAGFFANWMGPVRIWHGYPDPPEHVLDAAAYYEKPGAIIQHHSLDGSRVPARVFVTDEVRRFQAFAEPLRRRSIAQLQQDLWVLFETGSKRDGFFVEFGATNGCDISNTRLLEESCGWQGILAEPYPVWHKDLLRDDNRPRSRKDTRCVWSKTGERVSFVATDQAEFAGIESTLAKDGNAPARVARSKFVAGGKFEVETVSLADLLGHHQAPAEVDFLSIDTEGSELEILRAFFATPGRPRIKLIAVEHNYTPAEKELEELLVAHGYERRFASLSRWDAWFRLKDKS